LYISPYFNEVKAHDDLKLWPDVEDPATQHTMSARTMQILETYARLYKETGKQQPLLKQASFITAKEAMAAGEHGKNAVPLS
jgi:transaldolase